MSIHDGLCHATAKGQMIAISNEIRQNKEGRILLNFRSPDWKVELPKLLPGEVRPYTGTTGSGEIQAKQKLFVSHLVDGWKKLEKIHRDQRT